MARQAESAPSVKAAWARCTKLPILYVSREPLAVKVMLARSFGDKQALRRFEREAQAACRAADPSERRHHL